MAASSLKARSTSAPVLCAGILLCTAAACGPDGSNGDAGWSGTITDSAGVAVVSNPEGGVWRDGPPWHLEEEFRVGALDPETGEQDVQFGLVSGLDFDGAGRVYVADQQAQQIRVFDDAGRPLHTIGQPGQGPGEIGQGLAGVFVVGDEIWAADMSNMRVGRYAPEGEALGSFPLDYARGIPLIWRRVGERVVVQKRVMNPDAPAGVGDAVVALGPEATDTLTVLPPGESVQMGSDMPRFRIFAPEPLWDAAPDGRILSALNTDYRIEVRDAQGDLERIVTRPFETRPVTEGDQERLRGAMRSLMVEQGAPPPVVDQLLSGMTFADRYPAFARVVAGPRGTIWVQHIRTADQVTGDGSFNPQDMGADEWDVFGEDGRYLGVMTLPPRFSPLVVDGDALWGVQRDDFDVNSVVRYRLVDH